MICIIALVVFAVLALFSAKYRPLAAEAFDCVFRRVTLRPCTSGLDKRLKSQITGKLLKKHKALGKFVFKHFEILSWIFLIIMLLSLVQVGISGYNYAMYGNCNGPDEGGFCVFDPTGSNNEQITGVEMCMASEAGGETTLTAPNISRLSKNPKTGSSQAEVTVIEFGCFACPNTAKQADDVKKIIEHYGTDIQFVYVDFPLPHHEFSEESAQASYCVHEQDSLMYWKYHFLLFEEHEQLSEDNLKSWALGLGADEGAYDDCMASPESLLEIKKNSQIGMESGIYGTPTFFINDKAVVGVKNYNLLKVHIDRALAEN